MAKYKRSIKGGAFRPEQVSERGESRLQEYSDRITGALRDERDAVISNRNRIADAMRENANIESQQASTNAQIQQQNVQTQLNDIQAQNAAAQRQFENDTRAQQQIFSTVADLSLTASKKLREIEVERLQEKWNQDYYQTLALGDNDPNVRYVEALLKDSDAKRVEGYTALNAAKENGADELDLSEAGKKFKELSYGAKLATFAKVGQMYPSYLNQQFMDDTTQYTDRDGNTFTGSQASRNADRTAIVAAASMQRYLDLSRLTGTNPALLQKSGLLDAMLRQNQSVMKTAREANLADNNFKADSDLNYQLANAPDAATAKRIIETEWVDLVNRKGLEGAHNYLTKLFETVNSNGNPVYNEKALFAAELGPGGKAWGDHWPARRESIQKTLANARDAVFRQQEQRRQNNAIQDFRSRQDELNEQLSAAGARDDLDIIATAKKAYSDKYEGFIPPQLLDLERSVLKENKDEAAQKLEVVTQRARDGLLTQGEVLSIEDPTMRSQAQALLIEQNKIRRFGDDYEATLKSLAQDAKQITKNPLNAAGGEASEEVRLFMEKQFAAWYKEGLAQSNNNPTAALAYARQNHRAEFAKSMAGADDGLYVRKYDDNNGSVFPNIQAAKRRTEAVIDQNIARIEDQVGATGIGALDSPGLVSSAPELRNLSLIHYTGGSINELITPEIKAAARLLGVSEIEVINRQIAAFNKYNTDKIEPIRSPALDLVNNARPETQRLFTDQVTIASVDRGQAEVLQEPLRDPNNMRRSFAYMSGNIGPTSTGPHLDVKKVGGGEFSPNALDEYVEVDDPELGTVPLGQVPVTGDFASHTVRGSHGIDYGLYEGTGIYLKNGAKVVGTRPSVHGDVLTIELPTGEQYTFLHGKTARN